MTADRAVTPVPIFRVSDEASVKRHPKTKKGFGRRIFSRLPGGKTKREFVATPIDEKHEGGFYSPSGSEESLTNTSASTMTVNTTCSKPRISIRGKHFNRGYSYTLDEDERVNLTQSMPSVILREQIIAARRMVDLEGEDSVVNSQEDLSAPGDQRRYSDLATPSSPITDSDLEPSCFLSHSNQSLVVDSAGGLQAHMDMLALDEVSLDNTSESGLQVPRRLTRASRSVCADDNDDDVSKEPGMKVWCGENDVKVTEHVTEDDTSSCVNDYNVHETLGRGAYGVVKRVTCVSTGEQYAMKIVSKKRLLRTAFGRTRGPMKRGNAMNIIRKEIAVLKKLKHDNIVKLYEVMDDPSKDRLYLIFELLDGGSPIILKSDGTAESPLPLAVAQKYFCDLVLGMEYLHMRRIIHRDLKPDNLLIDKEGTLKITDFGVSEDYGDGSDIFKRSVGSTAFFAPEMCNGGGEFRGKSVDIWAMGVTLYAFVYGRLPFHAPNAIMLFRNIIESEVEYSDDMPPELNDLLRGMLQKDPGKRFTMDAIKNHPWVTQKGTKLLPVQTTMAGELVLVALASPREMRESIRSIGAGTLRHERKHSPLRDT
eukprot:Clim_evm1s118 gene=Clim_evmTU1s118